METEELYLFLLWSFLNKMKESTKCNFGGVILPKILSELTKIYGFREFKTLWWAFSTMTILIL